MPNDDDDEPLNWDSDKDQIIICNFGSDFISRTDWWLLLQKLVCSLSRLSNQHFNRQPMDKLVETHVNDLQTNCWTQNTKMA